MQRRSTRRAKLLWFSPEKRYSLVAKFYQFNAKAQVTQTNFPGTGME